MADVAATSTRALRRRIAMGRARRRRDGQVRAHLRTHAPVKLHLGAGHNVLEGWLNTDRDPAAGCIHLDVSQRFPLPDASCSRVFSEHLVEHLPYELGVEMLAESHRVLRHGGRIRVATPDLAVLAGEVLGHRSAVGERYTAWLRTSYFPGAHGRDATFALNQAMRGWGHKFLYDEATLASTLRAVGFVDVATRGFRESPDPALRGLEDHGLPDGNEELTRFETMCVEATRP